MASDDPYSFTARVKARVLLDPRIRKVHDYWMDKHHGARLPSRGDIDPVDLPDCLDVLLLLEVNDKRQDFTVRLAGTQVEQAFGRGLTGAEFATLFPNPEEADCLRRFRMAAITGQPDFRSADLGAVGRPFVRFDRATLPLSNDGSEITHLLSCYAFSTVDPA